MKGKNHLRMGACTVGCATAAGLVPWVSAPFVVAAGAGLFMFAKVAPDLDHKNSSVTRSWGPLSWLWSWLLRGFARLVYESTRGPRDKPGAAVHRGFTHTFPGAVFGGALSVLPIFAGPVATAICFALMLGAAGRVYDRGWLLYTACAGGAVGWFCWFDLLLAAPWLWFVFTVGSYFHAIDDCVTTQGAPLWYPRMIDGKRWGKVGPPEWMRFDTGSGYETAAVAGAVLVTSGLVYLLWLQPLLAPWIGRNFA